MINKRNLRKSVKINLDVSNASESSDKAASSVFKSNQEERGSPDIHVDYSSSSSSSSGSESESNSDSDEDSERT